MSRPLETWKTKFGSFADNFIPLAHNELEEKKRGKHAAQSNYKTPSKPPPERL